MRRTYSAAGLAERDLAADWTRQFAAWFDDAVAAGLPEPNAMALATASPTGAVACRTVLAKAVDAGGLVFYTNFESDKSRDLAANPVAAATFPWIALARQIHVRGPVVRVGDEQARAYWATRPRDSQLGAWASPQSRVLAGRDELDSLLAAAHERFPDDPDQSIPLPPFWGGWRIAPTSVEFWQGRVGRLHDRLRYRIGPDGEWVIERLAP